MGEAAGAGVGSAGSLGKSSAVMEGSGPGVGVRVCSGGMSTAVEATIGGASVGDGIGMLEERGVQEEVNSAARNNNPDAVSNPLRWECITRRSVE